MVRIRPPYRSRQSPSLTLYDRGVPSIVSVGGIAEDVVLRMRTLPSPGTCVTAAAMYRGIGGKAANEAVAAARLGGDVALLGCVGDDEAGRSLVTSLVAERVAVEHVTREHDTTTGTVILLRNEVGEKQVIVFPGANAALSLDAIDAAAPLLAAARVVLVQFEIPLSIVEHTVRLVRGTAARLVLDASPIRAFPRDLLRGAIVKANATIGADRRRRLRPGIGARGGGATDRDWGGGRHARSWPRGQPLRLPIGGSVSPAP